VDHAATGATSEKSSSCCGRECSPIRDKYLSLINKTQLWLTYSGSAHHGFQLRALDSIPLFRVLQPRYSNFIKMPDYQKKTVAELTEILKGRSLPHSGKKADLIARLNEADRAAEAPEGMRDSNDFSIMAMPRQNYSIVLSRRTQPRFNLIANIPLLQSPQYQRPHQNLSRRRLR
jgi:hypothetical protein